MLTRDEVVARLAELGQPMTASTWSSMVSRGQAPRPDETIGRTPRWAKTTIDTWVATRPGQGRRTDRGIHANHRVEITMAGHRATCRCGKTSPDYSRYPDQAGGDCREA